MLKNKKIRRLALLVSLITLLTSTVNTTFGFIVTKTDSLINTFTPLDSIVNELLLSKTVEHPFGEDYLIPDHIAFDFKVDFGSLYANSTVKTTAGDLIADENGSITVSLRPNKPLGIQEIDAGTKVTVTEMQKDGSGFAVKDGKATKEAVVSEKGNITIDFVNVYTPASVQPVNVSVGGRKELEGREWQIGDTFSFALEQKRSNDTWELVDTQTITYDPEDTAFDRFDFSDSVQALVMDKIGSYEFRMTEIAGDLENVDYDKTVNTFTIQVTDVDMDGKLEIGNIIGAQNAKVTKDSGRFDVSVAFNNTYVPVVVPDPDDTSVTISVNKTVNNTGEVNVGPEGFEFILENLSNGEKLVRTSDASGKAAFTLPFTAKDIGKTYAYKLSEIDQGMDGMTYDSKVYEITVLITPDEDNKLVATVTMNGETVDDAEASFENTYYAEEIVTPPTGDNGSVGFWVIMMIVSAMACTVLLIYEKRYTQIKHER